MERGERLAREGHVTEALRAYSEAIQLDSRNGAALLALAKLRLGMGETGEAELLFSTAIRQRSSAPEAYAARARLRRAQGRTEEAFHDLEMAVELTPDDLARAEELSRWHVERKAWLPALAIWRRALAVAPDERSEHRAAVQVRALALLAGDLDAVAAGRDASRSWTRRALATLGRR